MTETLKMTETEIIGLMKANGQMNKKPNKSKTPTYNITSQQLIDLEKRMYDKAYKEAYINALKDASDLLILISCMYLIDNYGCQEEGLVNFIRYYEHMNDLYGQGQYKLQDLANTIKEDMGIEIMHGDGKEYARKALERC